MDIPPAALTFFSYLPASTQESLQEFMVRAMQNPYIIPLATIPASWYIGYIPHFLKFGLMGFNKGIAYNNETPRTEDLAKYKYFPDMMVRAKSAHENAMEMFPYFAVAVLVARIQKVKPEVLTPLCLRYLGLRLLYTFLYVFGINKFVALMRTLSWGAMTKVCFQIITAGL